MVEGHCALWGIDPRRACRLLGVRLTPRLLVEVTEARSMSSLHAAWRRTDAMQPRDRGPARMELMRDAPPALLQAYLSS